MAKNVSKPQRSTPPIRVAFTRDLFTPKPYKAGDVPKHSITAMFDKNNKEDMAFLKLIHKDAEEALVEKWPDKKLRPRKPIVGDAGSPIKDGDESLNNNGIPYGEKNPEFKGHFFIGLSTARRPHIVSRANEDILDTNEIYGGCVCRISLNAYTYTGERNSGVTFGLNGVQKYSDGERFGGDGISGVDEMFEAEGGPNDPANYNTPDPFAGEKPAETSNANPFGD